MPVCTPNCFAARLAAMTMPSPCRPPSTHRGRPCNRSSSAISQLAKKLSPSTCRIRLGVRRFTTPFISTANFILSNPAGPERRKAVRPAFEKFAFEHRRASGDRPAGLQPALRSKQKKRGAWLPRHEWLSAGSSQNNLVAFLESNDGLFPIRRLAGLDGALPAQFTAHVERVDAQHLHLEQLLHGLTNLRFGGTSVRHHGVLIVLLALARAFLGKADGLDDFKNVHRWLTSSIAESPSPSHREFRDSMVWSNHSLLRRWLSFSNASLVNN